MLSPTPDSLSGGYAPSKAARPKSAIRQHRSGERSTPVRVRTMPASAAERHPFAASSSVSCEEDRSKPLRSATWLSCRQLRAAPSVGNVFLIVFCSGADHTCA
jgi:hypothetical protein